MSGGEAARTGTPGACEIVAPLAGLNWLCGSHDPAGLTLGLRLVRGRGHGLRVSTVSCVTARVAGHIRSTREGKAGSMRSSGPRNFLTVMRKGSPPGWIWDVCDSEAALAARFMLKFSHPVQFQVILSRHLQSLREDRNCALTWLHKWPCTEARDPRPRPVHSGLSGAAGAGACRRPEPRVLSGRHSAPRPFSPRASAEPWPVPPGPSLLPAPHRCLQRGSGFPCVECSVFSFRLAVTAVAWKAQSTALTRGLLGVAFLFLRPGPEQGGCAEQVCPPVALPEAGSLTAGGAGPGVCGQVPCSRQSSRSRTVWPGTGGAARASSATPLQ